MPKMKGLLDKTGSGTQRRKGGNDPGFAAAQPARASEASCWSFPPFRPDSYGKGQSREYAIRYGGSVL